MTILLKVGMDIFCPPPSVSNWYYCWCCSCRDSVGNMATVHSKAAVRIPVGPESNGLRATDFNTTPERFNIRPFTVVLPPLLSLFFFAFFAILKL